MYVCIYMYIYKLYYSYSYDVLCSDEEYKVFYVLKVEFIFTVKKKRGFCVSNLQLNVQTCEIIQTLNSTVDRVTDPCQQINESNSSCFTC